MKRISIFCAILFFMVGCNTQKDKQSNNDDHIPDSLVEVQALLDSVHAEDHKYRNGLGSLIEEHGWNSEEVQSQFKKMSETDSSNLILVEGILAKHGWLGGSSSSTLFLVIQHADQATQEKYLPVMRQAVNEGKAKAQSLALLEDRILLGRGEMQIYGSQILTDSSGNSYVRPLIEPEKVNERRAEVGLLPIEEYVSQWGIEWDVEAYKKQLPKRLEELKAQIK
ncbi:DUF6624 domain-containing protein [Limibacter armeniacum]|uniref:DUF6624 domain-containing protein n=1 Tax=Limibacter armeniacum TaxID=466084 RepID=UPI002FE66650